MNEKKILHFLKILSEKKYNTIFMHIIALLSLCSLLTALAMFNAFEFTSDYGLYIAAKEMLFSAAGTFSVGFSAAICFRKIKFK